MSKDKKQEATPIIRFRVVATEELETIPAVEELYRAHPNFYSFCLNVAAGCRYIWLVVQDKKSDLLKQPRIQLTAELEPLEGETLFIPLSIDLSDPYDDVQIAEAILSQIPDQYDPRLSSNPPATSRDVAVLREQFYNLLACARDSESRYSIKECWGEYGIRKANESLDRLAIFLDGRPWDDEGFDENL